MADDKQFQTVRRHVLPNHYCDKPIKFGQSFEMRVMDANNRPFTGLMFERYDIVSGGDLKLPRCSSKV